MRLRQRAQNVIEFGTGIAAVAFVALVGFTALGNAQQTYWGVVSNSPTFAAPTPAPGDFLHPTTMSRDVFGNRILVPNCSPTTIKVTTDFTCTSPTVTDIYSDSNEQKPPLGAIGLHLDGSPDPVATCDLVLPSGNKNSCTSLTWKPGEGDIGGHTFSLWYECAPRGACPASIAPQSNHQPSQSAPQGITVIADYIFTPTSVPCVNDLTGTGTMSVEVGHPLRCGVTFVDASSGTPVIQIGKIVTWSTSNVNGSGYSMLTCSATSVAIMSSCPTAGPSVSCTTDTTGTCYVVFRRIYDGYGTPGPASGSSQLTLQAGANPAEDYAAGTIRVVSPTAPNATGISVTCSDTLDKPHLDANNSIVTFGNAKFTLTSLTVNGPPLTTKAMCTAFVFDAEPNAVSSNNPSVSDAAQPNLDIDFPPQGTVTFDIYDGVSPTPIGSTSCLLIRTDLSTSYPTQAPGQAPFLSSCSPPGHLTITTPTAPVVARIDVSYAGEGIANPGHGPAASQTVHVDFK